MSDVKLCKDCKWCHVPLLDRILGFSYRFAKCVHPKNRDNPSKVTGEGRPLYSFCEVMRESEVFPEKVCGPSARWFEPKMTGRKRRLFMGVTEPDDARADDQRKGQGREINRR